MDNCKYIHWNPFRNKRKKMEIFHISHLQILLLKITISIHEFPFSDIIIWCYWNQTQFDSAASWSRQIVLWRKILPLTLLKIDWQQSLWMGLVIFLVVYYKQNSKSEAQDGKSLPCCPLWHILASRIYLLLHSPFT